MEDRCEKTEKRIGYAMVFFFIVFLFIGHKCSAQMKIYRDHRFPDKPKIVTFCPYSPITLVNKKDTVFLSVSGDSIEPRLIEMRVYAYFTKGISKYKGNLTMGFLGGKSCVFTPSYIDSSGSDLNYVEYEGPPLHYYHLTYTKYIYANFDGIKQFIAPRGKEDYFMEFYSTVYLKQ